MEKEKEVGKYHFKGCDTTLEEVFGKKPISLVEMLNLLLSFIEDNKLVNS
jgi:chromatin remodeling complex protein RSC6